MKTIEINLYEFDELSEEAQQKAIDNLWDLNVDYDWWQFIYDDAANNAGLKITGFDIGRGDNCTLEYIEGAKETAEKIVENWGDCEERGEAISFLAAYDNIKNEIEEDDLDYLEADFLKVLSKSYLFDLRKEYEWRTERDEIIETIKANEYTFTEDGKLRNF